MSDIKIRQSILKLKFDHILDQKIEVKDIRSALANLYPQERLLHQHREDGKLNYYYPLVQYKIINNECLLIGINDGAELLINLDLVAKKLSLIKQDYTIIDKEIDLYNISIAVIDTFKQYRFITPWLALNENNYKRYQRLGTQAKRRDILKKILIGNILSMAKGLEYVVTEEIKTEIDVRPIFTSLKGTPMLGFLGTFSVNFNIPNYLGLGKSVSRGFGTVVRVDTEK